MINFILPKEQTGGQYAVRCMISAFNEGTKEALVYVEFVEQVKENILERGLERLGARLHGRIESYSFHDYAQAATGGLQTVEKKALSPGFKLIERGSPAPYVRRVVTVENGIPLEVTKDMELSLEAADGKVSALEEELHDKVFWQSFSFSIDCVLTIVFQDTQIQTIREYADNKVAALNSELHILVMLMFALTLVILF